MDATATTTVTATSSPADVESLVAQLEACVTALAAHALGGPAAHPSVDETRGATGGRRPATTGIDGAAAVDVVSSALTTAGRLTALAAQLLPGLEADGWWSLSGARSLTTWVAGVARVTQGQAARLVELGRALHDDLPVTAVEATAGRVGLPAAQAIARAANTDARRNQLRRPAEECGEQFLVDQAKALPAAQFQLLVRRWAAAADPEADERGYRDAEDREHLLLSQTENGCHVSGFLTTEHGHALRAALDALAERCKTSPDAAHDDGLRAADASHDRAARDADPQEGGDSSRATFAGAGREPKRRTRARALVMMARLTLDQDLTGATGSHRPQITCVVDFEALLRALTRQGARGSSSVAPYAPEHSIMAEAGSAGLPAPVGDADRFAVADLVGTGPIPRQRPCSPGM